MKKYICFAIVSFVFFTCTPKDTTVTEEIHYSSLQLQPSVDSVFLAANGGSAAFSLGSVLHTSETTIYNTGVMTDADFTLKQTDTSLQSVDVAKAVWISSNSSVASVSNGVVVAHSAGYALISAAIGTISSNSVVVNVRAIDVAPGLSLDPPDVVFILENHILVSGIVQQQAKLSVTEPNSGFSAVNIPYNSSGAFAVTVTGLNPGLRSITARAVHPTNSSKYTDRTKTVPYYPPGSPEANAIVGNWIGTTLGTQFHFQISNSIIPTRYDITGKLDIQFEGIGVVRDIDLIGVLNNNGTIDVTLSKTAQGLSVTGKLNGYFKSTGTGAGSYSAQALKTGWPKISFSETWTAVKE